MPRYMIQMTHGNDHEACVRALHAIERYGGHLFTKAEWGCKVGVHSGWVVVEVESRHAAEQMVPPELRDDAQVIELNKFTHEEIASWVARLGDS